MTQFGVKVSNDTERVLGYLKTNKQTNKKSLENCTELLKCRFSYLFSILVVDSEESY